MEAINFLCFGRPGSGKSAFVNTVLAVLSERFMMVAESSDSQESVTQTINRYEINMNKTLVCRDVFGFSNDNFKEILQQLLNGELKDGFKQGDILEGQKRVTNPTINDKVHAVVFMMDATNIDKKQIIVNYKEYITNFKNRGNIYYIKIIKLILNL